MAQKALVTSMYNMAYVAGVYSIYVDASVEDGNEDHFNITAIATSTNWTPVSPSWKTRVANAVKAAAAEHDPPATVDAVMFPDLSPVTV